MVLLSFSNTYELSCLSSNYLKIKTFIKLARLVLKQGKLARFGIDQANIII